MARLTAKLTPKNGVPVRPAPAARAPVLTGETQAIFQKFEKEMGIPLLAYWTSSGGSICQNDVMAMSQLLDTRKHGSSVGLFLKSDGGNPEAARRAEAAGLMVVMNRCPKIEHSRLTGSIEWHGIASGVISSKKRAL